MTIQLTPEQEQSVRELVDAGTFASPQAVVEIALQRLLIDTVPAEALKRGAERGRADIKAGRFLLLEDLKSRLGVSGDEAC